MQIKFASGHAYICKLSNRILQGLLLSVLEIKTCGHFVRVSSE